jgi:DNA polymerase-3 subunit delta
MPAKKNTDIPRAYLLRGDDDYLKSQGLKDLLLELVSGDFGDFDFEQMDGDSATSDRVMSGVCIPPFGADRRVVLIKHAQRMPVDQQEKLAEKLLKIPESGCLIMVTPAPDKEEGRVKKGSEVVGELSRAVRKIGKIMEYGGGRPKDRASAAREFAQSLFIQAGRKIDAAALTLFLQRVGSDFSTVNSESRKLVDYSADSGKITQTDVLAVTSETPEDRIFALVDAIAERNQVMALKLLDGIFQVGADPNAEAPRTLSMIARQYRYIQQTRLIMDSRNRSLQKENLPDSVINMLPSSENVTDLVGRQSWQEGKLTKQAGKLTETDIAGAFGALARCDLQLKGAGAIEDPRMAMELLVCELSNPAK